MDGEMTRADKTMHEAIQRYLEKHRKELLAQLGEMVAINTLTRNKAGSDRLQKFIQPLMPGGYSLEIDRRAEVGDTYIYTYASPGTRPIALHGHIDTLCPADPTFDRLEARGERLYGPGLHDMKAGLLTLIWSLRTLAHLDLLRGRSFIVVFNADEEIGSIGSKKHFLALGGKQVRLGIKFECAALDNTLVTTRKGIAKFTLTARGTSAHFGNLKERKISAVEEIGYKIREIEALNRSDGTVAANVGRIGGGLASNVVADHAFMEFESRFWDRDVMEATLAAIDRLAVHPRVQGVTLELERTALVPPWQPDAASRQIFEKACRVGRDMGLPLVEEKRGGVSDANWVAEGGVPAIDGFGPVGEGDCTRGECIVTSSLFERVELTVRLLAELGG